MTLMGLDSDDEADIGKNEEENLMSRFGLGDQFREKDYS